MKGNLSDGDTDISAAKAIKVDIADEMAKLGILESSVGPEGPATMRFAQNHDVVQASSPIMARLVASAVGHLQVMAVCT